MIFARGNPQNALRFHRVAGKAHWQPGELPEGMEPGIREVATFTPPELEPPNDQNQINTSLTYGFVFDFCGVEIDRDTGQVRIDKYVTSHDSGTILNPLILKGQVYGAFAWAVGCALSEELAYSEDGQFLSATFADYLVPTVYEVPAPQVLHTVTPSPFTELGAKGGAEGNVMSTPPCLANAVCDALGIRHIDLPLSPAKISAIIHRDERPPPGGHVRLQPKSPAESKARVHAGNGQVVLPSTPQVVWDTLIDPQCLSRILPGCKEVKLRESNRYDAVVMLGAGPIKGEFNASLKLTELNPPHSVVLRGSLAGPLGASEGQGRIRLQAVGDRTELSYDYEVKISGKVAALGARMLDGATRIIIRQFFARLTGQLGGGAPAASMWRRVLQFIGLRR
jgi:2-furoyl-CoA dehydrogenase large subunit